MCRIQLSDKQPAEQLRLVAGNRLLGEPAPQCGSGRGFTQNTHSHCHHPAAEPSGASAWEDVSMLLPLVQH